MAIKLTELDDGAAIVDDDIFLTTQDVPTTPDSKIVTGTQFKAYIGAVNPFDQSLDTTDNVTFNNIDSTGIIKTDTVDEEVLNAGVTVDGVLIKDGLVDGVDVGALKTDVDGFPDELKNLTTPEIAQLENINTTTISTTQWGYVGGANQNVRTSDGVTFSSVNTGHGANELYAMNQNVRTTDPATFTTVNTGQGANELYPMNQSVLTTSAPTFATVNTGQGSNELYAMNQNVRTADNVTFATVNTGQGANDLYDMNQNVKTTDSVSFNSVTLPTIGGTPTPLDYYEEFSTTFIFDSPTLVWTLAVDVLTYFTRVGNMVTMHFNDNVVNTTKASPAADILLWAGLLIPAQFRPRKDITVYIRSVENSLFLANAGNMIIQSTGDIIIRKDASSAAWGSSQPVTGVTVGAWSWLTN